MFESLISLVVAAALLLGSPGPAPLALAATGAVFGVKNSLPFLVGVLMGLAVAISGAALGMNAVFLAFPQAALIVQIVGAAYIVYIAFKIASAPVIKNSEQTIHSVPTLGQGFLLNLLNPKAYAAFFALFSQFLLPFESNFAAYIVTGISCFFVAVLVDVIWLSLGGVLRPIFAHPKHARVLRVVMALMMLISIAWVIYHAVPTHKPQVGLVI